MAAWLLPSEIRRAAMAFYHFAITADDIADAPHLRAEDKLAVLDSLEQALRGRPHGGEASAARALREIVKADDRLIEHAALLLHAFRRDAVSDHCHDWADLITYCRYSAAPAGRFILTLHGEGPESFPAGDALCAALQILNLIQDCSEDFRTLGRVYMPVSWLRRSGVATDVFAGDHTPPELREVFNQVLDGVAGLMELARSLPRTLRCRRLRWQSGIVIALAERFSRRLRTADPVARAVRPTAYDVAAAIPTGLIHCFRSA